MKFARCSFSASKEQSVVVFLFSKDDSLGLEITRLYRIRKTVMQMLRDKGYLVGDFEINMTVYRLNEKYGNNMKKEDLVINKAKMNDSSDQVWGLEAPNFLLEVRFSAIHFAHGVFFSWILVVSL